MSPDTTAMEMPAGLNLGLPLPFNLPLAGFNLPLPLPLHLAAAAGIPQVHVPHDLARLTSMLRGDKDESGSTPNSRSSSVGPHLPFQIPAQPLQPLQVSSNNTQKSSSSSSASSNSNPLKRKKETGTPTPSNHNHMQAPRRSLRPRIERSYAESPDIVVDYEDEPPKVNGMSNNIVNGNGIDEDEEESDGEPGEMPPLPPENVRRYLF